jgi:ATP-binding cassette subfamily F protein 3
MMLQPANLLLLDEPTNHLDIASKEVLEEALLHYEGAVLVISHDRYFMSQIAKQIYAFEAGTVFRYDCDYHDFIHGKDDGVKEKIESRYLDGDSVGRITNAKEVIIEEVSNKSKKNFGGSGVTSGNLFKGIKNAKRYSNH